MSEVLHLGFFMKLASYTMSAKVAHHAETIGVCVLLYGIAQVANEHVRFGAHLFANLQTLPCHIHQALLLLCGLAYDKHTTCIGIVAVQYGGAIHVDYIAFLQNEVFAGDAMTHHLVHAGATRLGETFVVERSGYAAMFDSEIMHNAVYILGGHALTDAVCHLVEHGGIQCSGTTYALYLLGGLYQVPGGTQLTPILELQYAQIHLRGHQSGNKFPVLLYLVILCHVSLLLSLRMQRYD